MLQNMMTFTLPLNNESSNGLKSKDLVESLFSKKSVKNRYDAGINPITLLTERKRKVILNAMTDIHDIKETKELSKLKLDNYLANKERNLEDDLLFSPQNKCNSQKLNPINKSPLSRTSRDLNFHLSPKLQVSNKQVFKPEWNNYDTMQSRWKYLKPQVKSLADEQSLLVPLSKQSYLTIEETIPFNGNISDVNYFKSKTSCIQNQVRLRTNFSSNSNK
jgi:hypothetical protein